MIATGSEVVIGLPGDIAAVVLLYICRPVYMLHGHVHASYMGNFSRETVHPSGAVIVNGYDKYTIDLRERDRRFNKRVNIIRQIFRA